MESNSSLALKARFKELQTAAGKVHRKDVFSNILEND